LGKLSINILDAPILRHPLTWDHLRNRVQLEDRNKRTTSAPLLFVIRKYLRTSEFASSAFEDKIEVLVSGNRGYNEYQCL